VFKKTRTYVMISTAPHMTELRLSEKDVGTGHGHTGNLRIRHCISFYMANHKFVLKSLNRG